MDGFREKILKIKSTISFLKKKRNGFLFNISCDEINKIISEITVYFNEEIRKYYRQLNREYLQANRPSRGLEIMNLATNSIVMNVLQNLEKDCSIYLCNFLSSSDLQETRKWITNKKNDFLNEENNEIILVDSNIAQPVDLEKYADFRVVGPDFFKDVRDLLGLLIKQYNILVGGCSGKSNKSIPKNKLFNSQVDEIFSNLDKLCDLLTNKIEILQGRKSEILRYNTDVNQYNELVAIFKKNNDNNCRFYKEWKNKIEKSNVYRCVKLLKYYNQNVTSINQMLNSIKKRLIASNEVISSFEERLKTLREKYDSGRSLLIRLFNNNPQYTLEEKINRIITNNTLLEVYNMMSNLHNDVKEYLDKINKEKMLLDRLSFIDDKLSNQSIGSSVDKNKSLSESQKACMIYLTEQFKNLYNECYNLFANGNIFNHSQTDDEKYNNYIRVASIEGSFIGILAVFIEFISYSRFKESKFVRCGERNFDRNDEQNNNNVEITYLKGLLPEIFKDLRFDDIYNGKGFLRYVDDKKIKYSNEFAFSFIYQVLKRFLDGINFLLKFCHVGFGEASRIGNPFNEYYVKRINDMEYNGIKSNLDEYRETVIQRMYKSFVDCRNYLGIDNYYEDWRQKLHGPSWEFNTSDAQDYYQYYSTAFELPSDISYSEINIYILKIYRMLYEIEKRFVEPLCPNEFIDNYIKELLRDESHKK